MKKTTSEIRAPRLDDLKRLTLARKAREHRQAQYAAITATLQATGNLPK